MAANIKTLSFDAAFRNNSDGVEKTFSCSITVNVDEWECPREAIIFHVATKIVGTDGFERDHCTFVPKSIRIWRTHTPSDLAWR